MPKAGQAIFQFIVIGQTARVRRWISSAVLPPHSFLRPITSPCAQRLVPTSKNYVSSRSANRDTGHAANTSSSPGYLIKSRRATASFSLLTNLPPCPSPCSILPVLVCPLCTPPSTSFRTSSCLNHRQGGIKPCPSTAELSMIAGDRGQAKTADGGSTLHFSLRSLSSPSCHHVSCYSLRRRR